MKVVAPAKAERMASGSGRSRANFTLSAARNSAPSGFPWPSIVRMDSMDSSVVWTGAGTAKRQSA
mgnify:CR=1 FL=1